MKRRMTINVMTISLLLGLAPVSQGQAVEGCTTASFTPAGSPVGVGDGPVSVAVGDFNLDGKPDLATANSFSNTVTILLGNGMGGFTPPANPSVGVVDFPVSVAVGDFTLDGKPDLAVTSSTSAHVMILLGDGMGSFTPASSPVDVGALPVSVAVGDFTLDGKPDLATANSFSNTVTILLGNGMGGFTPPANPSVGVVDFPVSVAVGDFTLDGKPDLAVTSSTSAHVMILLGDGMGSFTPASSPVDVGALPVSVAVGDFTLDGKPDLATANSGNDNVTILLNTCGATSTGPPSMPGIPVVVDIKPGKARNRINLKSRGSIPVAILTTASFDATTVDPLSLKFGPGGDIHGQGHLVDANGDSKLDLVLRFKIRETAIRCGDTSASLTSKTFSGQDIQGTDAIQTVGCCTDDDDDALDSDEDHGQQRE